MFSNEFYRKELIQNRERIRKHAEQLEDNFRMQVTNQDNIREDWRDTDYESRLALRNDYNFGTVRVESPFMYKMAIPEPYFLHVKDSDHYSYISSFISLDKDILKYTSSRASYLRYNSDEIVELVIEGDSVKQSPSGQKQDNNIQSSYKIELPKDHQDNKHEGSISNISNKLLQEKDKAIRTPNKSNIFTSRSVVLGKPNSFMQKKRDARSISNISDSLLQEQDQTIRTSNKSNTLITGPAGSGKTNSLIHRIDYLLSEERVFKNEIALFCFNVALKKYLDQSVKDVVRDGILVINFDKWQKDLMEGSFTGSLPDIDYSNYKKLGSDSDVINFVSMLSRKLSYSYLKNRLLKAFQSNPILLQNIGLYAFENKWDSGLENSSSIECFFSCGSFLCDTKTEVRITDRDPFLFESKTDKKARAERVDRRRKVFNRLTEEIFGYDGWKFNIASIIGIWNKYNKNKNITIEDVKSPIIRSQLLYITKALSRCIPNNTGLLSKHNDIFKSFDHILVDEFQDLGAHQLLLIENFARQGITIAGDITQSLYLEPTTGNISFNFPIHNSFQLSVTHRSTLETVLFANKILKKENQNYMLPSQVMNQGDKPLICEISSEKRVADLIKTAMKKYPTSSFLLTSYKKDECENLFRILYGSGLKEAYIAERDSWDFNKNLHIANYLQVKGLEFDYVIITGIGSFLKNPGSNKENILYTVLTRAKKRVIILHNGEREVDDMLKGIDKSLYETKIY